jgi:hypothetical protein
MTNLSDLFPAGAGKQVSFVADGSISAAGEPVSLTAAGKAAPITSGSAALGSETSFSTGNVEKLSSTFDVNAGKILIVYMDGDVSDNGYCIVGTVSGTTISYGTAVVLNSASTPNTACAYDANAQKVVVSYSNGNIGTAVVGTISGTTITFGTPVVYNTPGNTNYQNVVYDSDSQKVVIVYQDGGTSDHGTAIVGTVSGTSISFGTKVVFEAAVTGYIGACFDSTTNQVVIGYEDTGNSSYGTAIVGAVSGTSISFGTPTVFESAETEWTQMAYDTTAEKVATIYQDVGNSEYGTGIVGTVSGTGISFGSPTVFSAEETDSISLAYNTQASATVITYRLNVASDGELITATISGDSISFTTPVVVTAEGNNYTTVYDSTAAKTVSAWKDPGVTNDGRSIVSQQAYTTLTAAGLLGISDAAISDTASGNITVKGGIAVNGLTSLTPGTDYYAQTDGTISTSSAGSAVKLGRALSATSIDLEYQS